MLDGQWPTPSRFFTKKPWRPILPKATMRTRDEYLVVWKPKDGCPQTKACRSASAVLGLCTSLENKNGPLDYLHVEHRIKVSTWGRLADFGALLRAGAVGAIRRSPETSVDS